LYFLTRNNDPSESDWFKLKLFLKSTQDDIEKKSADDSQTVNWYVDSAFAVHKDHDREYECYQQG